LVLLLYETVDLSMQKFLVQQLADFQKRIYFRTRDARMYFSTEQQCWMDTIK